MEPQMYGPKKQEIITRLANQIAPAIQNAQLYEERLLAEETHRATAARAQAVMDTAADGIITIGQLGIIESFNLAAEAIFGYQTAEVVGQNVSMLMPESHEETHDGIIARYLATGESQILNANREVAGQRKDGTIFPMELSMGVVEIGDTKVFTGIIRDITERKATEARLIETSRLASLGELTAGVAHEINNPLSTIILSADFLNDADLSSDASADVKKISESARRAAKIVQNMLYFARKSVPEPEKMTVDLVVKQALDLKAHDFRLNKIKCSVEIEDGLPTCLIDRLQIGQVIINVLSNAEQALAKHQGGGEIAISISSSSDCVILQIRDDGPGIEPELISRIFEPFFTTKPTGEGTGLGLSISRGIIQRHGGAMWAANNEGAGATMFIQLPKTHM